MTSFLWVWFQCVCPLMPSHNTYRFTWVSLTLDVGYLFTAAPAEHSCCSLPWMRGISSRRPSWPSAEEVEVEQFYEDLQDLLELTPKKDILFTIGDWNAKVGSQKISGVIGKCGLGYSNEAGWSGSKANRVLPNERTGHSTHPLPTTQEKTLHVDIMRWSTLKSHWLYSLQ